MPPGRISAPSGRISSAATIPRSAAITSFWTPTSQTGSGASSRSSISLVNENSITSGSAVFCSEVRHERQREDAGQQLRAVGARRRADLGQHAAEDEQEEDRLQQRLGEERDRLVADRDPQVALAEGEEVRPTHAATLMRSSRPGQVDEDVLERALDAAQLDDSRAAGLGGRRRRRRAPSASP